MEYKKITAQKNDMWIGAMGGQTRWGFDRSKFFDAANDPKGAINNEEFESGVGFTYNTTHDNYGVIAKRDGHFSKPIYELTTGDHYFCILGRSGGFRIDKIHFFREGVDGFKDDTEPLTPVLPGDAGS